MLKSTILLAILSVGIKLLGFGREVALSYSFGVSAITDAYILSIAIPGLFFSIISSALNSVYIPYVSKYNNEKEKIELTSFLINMSIILMLVLILLINIYSTQLISIYTGGVNAEITKITESMLRLTSTTLIVRIIIVILNSYLQVKEYYITTNLIGLPLNILIIISILMASEENYEVLSIGFTIAMYSQLLVVLPYLYISKFKYIFNSRLSKYLEYSSFGKIITFVMIVALINQLNTIVDLRVASNLGVGFLSSINYALKLQILIQMVFVTSLTIVFFPKLSQLYNTKSDTIGLLDRSIKIIIFFIIPVSVFTYKESYSIIKLVFGYGAFDIKAVDQTSLALKYYAIGFVAFGIRELLLKDYYASNRVRDIFWLTLVSVVANIVLTIVLASYYGISGIAVSTSISAFLLIFIIYVDMYRRRETNLLKLQYVEIIKCIVVSFFSFELIRYLYIPNIMLDGVLFVLIYLSISYLAKSEIYKNIGFKL